MNLAIDAGGTNLRASIRKNNDDKININAKSDEIGLASFIEKILNLHKNIKTIGISYAGQVKDGTIIDAPNIKVDIADIKKYFETKYDISLFIENDLTCAVIAEAKELKSKNICALYVGTGIGLGVINDGKIIKGSSNQACEIGHIPYKKAPFKCGCGRDNCIENFVSGTAIAKWINHYNLTCRATLEALENDINPDSKEVLKEFEEALFYAIGTTITLFNPEILVLGGGIIEANPYLRDKVITKIGSFALKPTLENCKIIKSQLSDAPLIGASLLKDIK